MMMIEVLQLIHHGTNKNIGQDSLKRMVLVLRNLSGIPIGTEHKFYEPWLGKGRFQFCFSDDEEIKTEFRSSFGARQGFYWSFSDKENVHWVIHQDEDDTSPEVNLASERLALGLSASGPLKLAEVKEAFRACALRWHPDRHHGSSKVEAEERFKSCLAAYQSLSEKLAAG
ncbi:unnamed protein product [Spirodela intermedia]|uniref:J domain-containing protein n=1 Tax=Spirodela intermedia TaxID=51605 RepID=A0A7I8JV10_SPIIN|nr:unnamed protein product [Spirodela intermedia]CAA6673443.1 unnamed protein product [Spirodela intermedia]